MNLYFRFVILNFVARLRPKLSLWDTARTPFRVAPTDLDLLGHMNNSKYLAIMDLARLDLLMRSGIWKKLQKAGWYPVVASQTITYRRSLQLGQKFDVYSKVTGFYKEWAYVEQTFVVGHAIYAQAQVRARFLKKEGGTVTKKELEELYGSPFPDDRGVESWVKDWTHATRFSEAEEQKKLFG